MSILKKLKEQLKLMTEEEVEIMKAKVNEIAKQLENNDYNSEDFEIITIDSIPEKDNMYIINFIKCNKSCCEQCCYNKGYCTRASVKENVIGCCWFEEEY